MQAHLFRPGLGLPTKTIHDDHDSPWGYYLYAVREDDLVREMYFINVIDHRVQVQSQGEDGIWYDWPRRYEGEYLIFSPHDSYKGEQQLVQIHHYPEVQAFIAAPRKILERFALGNRTSVNFGG